MYSLLQNEWVSYGATAILGALATAAGASLRNRIRKMSYRVTHERVAFSTDDAVFGNVQANWQGNPVTNLYTSTVTLENTTTTDYEKLNFRLFAGVGTVLLNQYTEIPGTSFVVKFTDEYKKSLQIPAGENPTEPQWQIYHNRREYVLPVFNRRQKAVVRFLTTVPNGGNPAVWLDMLHPGVTAKYIPNVPEVWGVPMSFAIMTGLLVCICFYVLSVLIFSPWTAALICLLTGILARILGAAVYKTASFVFRLVFK